MVASQRAPTAACSAAYFLLGERGVASSDPIGLVTWGLMIGAVAMLGVSQPWAIPGRLLTAPARLSAFHLPVWQLLVIMAVVATVIAYLASSAALRHLPPSVVSVVSLLEPVVATALAWALLGQALSAVQILGGVVLLGGALIVRLAGQPTPAGEPLPSQTGITVGTIMGRRR